MPPVPILFGPRGVRFDMGALRVRVGYTYESQPPVLLCIGPVPGVFRLADRVPVHRECVVLLAPMRLTGQSVPFLCLFLTGSPLLTKGSPFFF